MDLKNAIDLPSLDEVESVEQQRLQTLQSLEVIDNTVKCQSCCNFESLGEKLTTTRHHLHRISALKTRIKLIEDKYPRATEDLRRLKEELDQLIEEDAKKELQRRIRLYSSAATGYRWVCSQCFDLAYKRAQRGKK
jgi:archaellum component FlaC